MAISKEKSWRDIDAHSSYQLNSHPFISTEGRIASHSLEKILTNPRFSDLELPIYILRSVFLEGQYYHGIEKFSLDP